MSPEPRKVPLAGNSIGTDRRFLAAYMPELEKYLHYRCVDVSTIKELARRWYPEASPPPPKGWRPPRSGRHQGERRRAEILAQHSFQRKIFPFARLAWHHG